VVRAGTEPPMEVWRSDVEEVGRCLVEEGAEALLQGQLHEALASFDNALLIAPSCRPTMVQTPHSANFRLMMSDHSLARPCPPALVSAS
jgi:hypothetical protein